MISPHIFPIIIVCLYVCSMVHYALQRDYARMLYWFAAAMITISATFPGWLNRVLGGTGVVG